jgi:hypothetical protein
LSGGFEKERDFGWHGKRGDRDPGGTHSAHELNRPIKRQRDAFDAIRSEDMENRVGGNNRENPLRSVN